MDGKRCLTLWIVIDEDISKIIEQKGNCIEDVKILMESNKFNN